MRVQIDTRKREIVINEPIVLGELIRFLEETERRNEWETYMVRPKWGRGMFPKGEVTDKKWYSDEN